MKTKGFTLIELLAVIIILGLIAVITTPKINEQINKSRKNISKTSAQSYIKVIDEYLLHEQMNKNKIILNGTYTINENGSLTKESETHEIKFNGEKPKGTLTFIENEIQSGCVQINKYKTTIENGNIKDTEKGTCED